MKSQSNESCHGRHHAALFSSSRIRRSPSRSKTRSELMITLSPKWAAWSESNTPTPCSFIKPAAKKNTFASPLRRSAISNTSTSSRAASSLNSASSSSSPSVEFGGWARAVGDKTGDPELAERFRRVGKSLSKEKDKILAELAAAQGKPVDIGGYFHPDEDMAANAMRPSATLNAIIDSV